MSHNSLKINLRAMREKFGYTQQQLANVLNIDRSTYSYYESGKTSPDIHTLITLSNVFSISMDELIGQEDSPQFVYDSGSKRRPSVKRNSDNHSHIYDLKKEELQLIAFFRSVSPEKRIQILDSAKAIAISEKK